MKRESWRDGLRGIVIALLICHHATTRPYWSAGLEPMPWLMDVFAVLKPMRMPVLMVLSGSLLGRSLGKDLTRFYVGKLRTLAWPLTIWLVITMATLDRMAELPSWPTWIGSFYLWFISYLFAYFCLAPLLGRASVWLVPIGALAATLVLRGSGMGEEARFVLFLGFFFVGYDAARSGLVNRFAEPAWLRWSGLGAAACTAFVLLTAPAVRDASDSADLRLLAAGGVVWSIWAIGLAQRFWRPGLAPLVETWGRHSVVLYCSQMPVMILTTTTLSSWGVRDPLVLTVANVLIGMGAGTALIAWREHQLVSWLFDFPGDIVARSDNREPVVR
jgi:fucose 4-O-acetylase-like acetyltransferase